MAPANTGMTQLATASGRKKKAEASSSSEIAEEQVRQKYSLDTDTLECPICVEVFSPPVYQCENGHTTCSACCEKITNRCPSCSQRTGCIRNIAIEKVIESLQVDCKHGCNTMVKYTERDEHENNLCEYRPIRCPVMFYPADCPHTGPKVTIPMHLAHAHLVQVVECPGFMRSASFKMKASDIVLVMFKAEEGAWLLVYLTKNSQGHSFYCSSVEASKEVAYKLTVKPVKLNRTLRKVYSMENVAHYERGYGWEWKDDYLLVPGTRLDEFKITVSLV